MAKKVDRTGSPRVYKNDYLAQIAFPLGGIGAGSISINGIGGLQDFAIRNAPSLTAQPDGHATTDAAFALLHIKGKRPALTITRLLEGPMPLGRISAQGLKSQGYRGGGHEGLPRCEDCTFVGEYPIAEVSLEDSELPVDVGITAWSPLIPLDDRNSSLPAAIVEYSFTNDSKQAVDCEFSFHLSHLASGADPSGKSSRSAVIPGGGVFFHNTDPWEAETFGSAALVALPPRSMVGGNSEVQKRAPRIKAMWYRGGWFDSISALWREISTGNFASNQGSDQAEAGRNGGSILLALRIAPGQTVTCPILITWHFPNVTTRSGQPVESNLPALRGEARSAPPWHPYYAGQWRHAGEVAQYVATNFTSLRQRTFAFRDALFASTVPAPLLDAVSANLAILKSPTILRQQNGDLWGWEGCFPNAGCCAGSCTHVWNYAQALPHLFPALERTLRNQEYLFAMNDAGHVNFRFALPQGPSGHDFHAAADGQLGGILKLYRDYHICGDRKWLTALYPSAKRALDYAIATWDPDGRGALFEPHHNTYDIEFWGPDGMCSSIYVAACAALAELAGDLAASSADANHAGSHSYSADITFYRALAEKGAKFLDDDLFNGDYFVQKVTATGLRNTSLEAQLATVNAQSPESVQLLKREGPKYQYGSGCLSDGVIGAWMARIYGVPTPQNAAHVRKHLKSIFKHNFKPDLFRHANTQRPGYAIGHEAGLLLCSWPRGDKPTLPFVYSDEVWTGIEYQVASHMLEEGLVEEAITIIAAARSRYDGRVRNPWNEYECGNFYARAMASYALLNSYAGFRYDAVSGTLHLNPRTDKRPFTTFFSTAAGFGTVTLEKSRLSVRVLEGALEVQKFRYGAAAPMRLKLLATPQIEVNIDLARPAAKR